MRRWVTIVAGLALAVASPAFAAGHRHQESATYRTPGGVQGVVNGSTNVEGAHLGFVQLASSARDRAVRVTVADATGLPVAFALAQWDAHAPDGEYDLGSYCGTSALRRLPDPGSSVVVYLNVGSCPDGPSAPTTGTVTALYR
jgi:hypothetical protein